MPPIHRRRNLSPPSKKMTSTRPRRRTTFQQWIRNEPLEQRVLSDSEEEPDGIPLVVQDATSARDSGDSVEVTATMNVIGAGDKEDSLRVTARQVGPSFASISDGYGQTAESQSGNAPNTGIDTRVGLAIFDGVIPELLEDESSRTFRNLYAIISQQIKKELEAKRQQLTEANKKELEAERQQLTGANKKELEAEGQRLIEQNKQQFEADFQQLIEQNKQQFEAVLQRLLDTNQGQLEVECALLCEENELRLAKQRHELIIRNEVKVEDEFELQIK